MPEPAHTGEADLAASVEAIEACLAAGDRDGAQALLAQIKPELGQGITFVRDLDSLNLYSGLALGCKLAGRPSEAGGYAMRAAIADPGDVLAHALLPRATIIGLGRQLTHHGHFVRAKRLFETAHSVAADGESKFYVEVFAHYGAMKQAALALPAGVARGRPSLLNAVFWGEAFVEKFLRYALPSLLAPGNLPALAAQGGVIIDIHTTEDSIPLLQRSPVVEAAQKYAEFTYHRVPEDLLKAPRSDTTPDPDRWCVSGAQYVSAMRARRMGADLSYLFCEGLYSGNFMAGAKRFLQDGHKAVAIMSLHAQERNIETLLQTRRDPARHVIDVETPALMDYATRNLTRQFFNSFIRSDSPALHQDPILTLYKTQTGFASHSFQLSPAMIAHDFLPDDLTFDFHTADARLLAELCGGGDPASLVKTVLHPEAAFFVIDLDSGEGGTGRIFGEFPMTPESCAASGLKWCNRESDFAYFDWAFRQRFEVGLPDAGRVLPDSDMAEDETVERIMTAFHNGSAGFRQRIAFLQGDSRG